MTRPHIELDELVRDAAQDRGMSVSDYLAWHLAVAHGRPELAPPAPVPSAQAELPILRGGGRLKQSA